MVSMPWKNNFPVDIKVQSISNGGAITEPPIPQQSMIPSVSTQNRTLQSSIYILALYTKWYCSGTHRVRGGLEVQVQRTTGWSLHLLREEPVTIPGHHQVDTMR